MPSNATRAPDAVNPERLRAAVLFWKGKVSSLQTEYREANYNKTHGKSRSAPGSLESWDSKAARLQVELSRTRVSLQLAIAKLAEASPSDPLLSGTASEP